MLDLVLAHIRVWGGPHQHKESHNTLIDWLASTGFVGMLVYGWLLWHIAGACIRSGRGWLFGAFLTMQIFSLFHYVVRQPIYWFYMIMILVLAQAFSEADRQMRAAAQEHDYNYDYTQS